MSTTKRINGEYTITNKGTGLTSGANITISTNTLYIDGNLQIGGNSTSVNHTELNITDNLITLNKGETGAGVTLGYAGIYVDRGTQPNVAIEWNETTKFWTLSNDGTNFYNIPTTASFLSNVYSDTSPALSANLDLRGRKIFNSNIAGPVTGNTALFIGNVGAAGTGVYATNNTYTTTSNTEVINKARSIAYSIIFGS